jgi:hypothetical protein
MLTSSLKEVVMAHHRRPIRIRVEIWQQMANRIEVVVGVQREELTVVAKPQTTEAKEQRAS